MTKLRLSPISLIALLALLTASGAAPAAGPTREVGLEDLDLSRMTVGYGKVQQNLSLDGVLRIQNVLDNLIHRKEIPVTTRDLHHARPPQRGVPGEPGLQQPE